MKLIDLHKEWCEKGFIKSNGLCNSVPFQYRRKLKQFYPTIEEWHDFSPLFGIPRGYWGYDGTTDNMFNRPMIARKFSPLRQTIVLLICAMNNEL